LAIGFRSITALKAIRLSDQTRSQLGDSYAKLSSGQRINKPSLDPAGLAVSLSLGVEGRVSNRAKLNTEDGVSLASYAEAAFGSATEIVTRMNELANQAANGILKNDQRNALNTEFVALREELDRIQRSSSFNGRAVNYGEATTANSKTVGAVSSFISSDQSADGSLLYFQDSSGNIKVRDMRTDVTTTLITGADGVSQISVSAAGDKLAYAKSGNIYVYDALTGTSTLAIEDTGSISSLEISGDGSYVAAIARSHADEAGENVGSDGYYHVRGYNTVTGLAYGDNANYGFSPGSNGISVSYNGDYVGVQGQEDYVFGSTQEVYVFSTANLSGVQYATSTGNRMVNKFAMDNSGTIYTAGTNAIVTYSESNISTANTVANLGSSITFLGLTDGGTSLALTTTANPTGDNKSGNNQLFKFDISNRSYRQISNFTNNAFATQISGISDDGFTSLVIDGSSYKAFDLSPTLNIGIDTGSGISGLVRVGIVSLDGAARGLKGYTIATASEAKSVAGALNRALEGLELGRASVGAGVSRLQSASRALAVKGTEQQAAFARITDVDTAESVANLVRLQVLSKAQTAVIAQSSKLVPQTALKLLQAA
jgi:flagellin